MNLKEKIVFTALDIFSEKGYTKATISEICTKAGTSKGGFYHHFKSKDEILDEITNMYFKEVLDRYDQLLEKSDEDVITLLENVFQTINTYKEEQLSKWESITKLYAHRDSHLVIRKLADNFEEVTMKVHLSLLEKGIKTGEITVTNPKALAKMWSMLLIQLYAKINEIVANPNSQDLIEEYHEFALFVEDTVNFSIKVKPRNINITLYAKEYLKQVLDKMKDMGLL